MTRRHFCRARMFDVAELVAHLRRQVDRLASRMMRHGPGREDYAHTDGGPSVVCRAGVELYWSIVRPLGQLESRITRAAWTWTRA